MKAVVYKGNGQIVLKNVLCRKSWMKRMRSLR